MRREEHLGAPNTTLSLLFIRILIWSSRSPHQTGFFRESGERQSLFGGVVSPFGGVDDTNSGVGETARIGAGDFCDDLFRTDKVGDGNLGNFGDIGLGDFGDELVSLGDLNFGEGGELLLSDEPDEKKKGDDFLIDDLSDFT